MYNHQLTIHSHNFHKHSCHIRSYSHHHNSSHRRQTYLTSPITRSKQLHHLQCYPQKVLGSPPLTRERPERLRLPTFTRQDHPRLRGKDC